MNKILKIGGHIVNVEYKLLPDANGEFDYETNTITISTDISPSHQQAALLHEILHCLNSTLDSHDYGHAFLDSLAEQLYQVLSDNSVCFCKEHMF